MNTLQEATEVLRTAQQRLRALIVQAAEQAEYDHLQQLAEWAKQLNTVLGAHAVPETSQEAAQDQGEPVPVQTRNGSHGRPAPAKGRGAFSGTRAAGKNGRGKKSRKSKKRPEYPKFFREGESLVKVGWSRREGKPYEHKAPRSVLQALVQALTPAGKGGQRFTMEGIFPLKDPVDRSEIPDYQAYLTLAWIRGAGLIVQHGRQGYSLLKEIDLASESDRLWNNLPAR